MGGWICLEGVGGCNTTFAGQSSYCMVDVVDVVDRAGESLFYLRMDSLCLALVGRVVLEHAQIVVK